MSFWVSGCLWVSMDVYGHGSWMSVMGVYGYLWVSMGFYGFLLILSFKNSRRFENPRKRLKSHLCYKKKRMHSPAIRTENSHSLIKSLFSSVRSSIRSNDCVIFVGMQLFEAYATVFPVIQYNSFHSYIFYGAQTIEKTRSNISLAQVVADILSVVVFSKDIFCVDFCRGFFPLIFLPRF